MSRPASSMINRLAPAACGAVLLAALAFANFGGEPIPGAVEYHARVREAIEKIPYRIGAWVGDDIETPPAAVRLLKPNKIIQRKYVDLGSGETFHLLVVHCQQTRDMLGHYPPQCYPAHGWTQEAVRETTLEFNGQTFAARDYEFDRPGQSAEQRMLIYSFFVLPNRNIVADMETLNRVSGRRAASQLGAAQVQILGGENMPKEQRRKIISEFILAIEPVIREVAEGVGHG